MSSNANTASDSSIVVVPCQKLTNKKLKLSELGFFGRGAFDRLFPKQFEKLGKLI
jgi:hypothetical protein